VGGRKVSWQAVGPFEFPELAGSGMAALEQKIRKIFIISRRLWRLATHMAIVTLPRN
jgi:hypothetical protein